MELAGNATLADQRELARRAVGELGAYFDASPRAAPACVAPGPAARRRARTRSDSGARSARSGAGAGTICGRARQAQRLLRADDAGLRLPASRRVALRRGAAGGIRRATAAVGIG